MIEPCLHAYFDPEPVPQAYERRSSFSIFRRDSDHEIAEGGEYHKPRSVAALFTLQKRTTYKEKTGAAADKSLSKDAPERENAVFVCGSCERITAFS
ncbi:MAG TPA: hypothetical protein VGF01_20105 [Terracidiphilus sp.]